jgi:hypothetical protein
MVAERNSEMWVTVGFHGILHGSGGHRMLHGNRYWRKTRISLIFLIMWKSYSTTPDKQAILRHGPHSDTHLYWLYHWHLRVRSVAIHEKSPKTQRLWWYRLSGSNIFDLSVSCFRVCHQFWSNSKFILILHQDSNSHCIHAMRVINTNFTDLRYISPKWATNYKKMMHLIC